MRVLMDRKHLSRARIKMVIVVDVKESVGVDSRAEGKR